MVCWFRKLGIVWVAAALLFGCAKKEQAKRPQNLSPAQNTQQFLTQSLNILDGYQEETIASFVRQEQPLQQKNPICQGVAATQANLHLYVENTTTLRIDAQPADTAEVDLVLLIASEQGGVLCSDDVDGLNPAIDTIFEPGSYGVWVGAHGEVHDPAVEIRVSDVLATLPQGPAPKALDVGNYGGWRIAPDTGPAQMNGQGGGTRSATDIGPGCEGFIGMRPDHILLLNEEMKLRTSAHAADADLVLLLQHSSGKVLCNDDADGSNPVIHAAMDAGTWNVYVGTVLPSSYPEYLFRVSR